MSVLAWLVLAAFVVALLAMWIAFTSTRLDRLHVRVDATYAALDAALVRRAAAVLHLADISGVAISALDAAGFDVFGPDAVKSDTVESDAVKSDAVGSDAVGEGETAAEDKADTADTAASPILDEALAQRLATAAQLALAAPALDRERVGNAVSKAVNALGQRRSSLPARLDHPVHEITESSARVVMARRFYNDAVRDTRSLRSQSMPRLLRLAGHRELPDFFDIDDSTTMTLTYSASSPVSAVKGS